MDKEAATGWDTLLCEDRIRSFARKAGASDLRPEFEKDCYRIIGNTSFRRFQDETQVFPLGRSDFIRTRLTHSLEVSSSAKPLGQNILESIRKNVRDEMFTLEHKAAICDILQCVGLIHDIGNPPFGHFGETAIQEWSKKNLDRLEFEGTPVVELLNEQMVQGFYHFEGNTQVFRVATKLHFLVDEHGMSLTKGLLRAIAKYPGSSLETNPESGNIKDKKMGYFYVDRENFQDVEMLTGVNGMRHPLVFILEAADDIVYRTADIGDVVKKGCITHEQLVAELKGYQPEKQNEKYKAVVSWLEERYQKALDEKYSRPDLYVVQDWVVNVQGQAISGATYGFTSHYGEIINGTHGAELLEGTDVNLLMKALGDIAYRYASISKPILKLETAAGTIFNFLLDKSVDVVVYYDAGTRLKVVQEKMMSLTSDDYKKVYGIYSEGKPKEEKLYPRLLLVTDYICGMTNSYAKSSYQESNGIVQKDVGNHRLAADLMDEQGDLY